MYLWLKALHFISMVAWFAGLFYIFRLFVYHVENKDKPDVTSTLEVMEKKLMFLIMFPAMTLTLVFGFWMLGKNPELMKQGWIHAKLTLVLLLVIYHHYAVYVRKKFLKKEFFLSSKACRIINEVPTICLILIIILAVLRPF